MLNRRTLLRYIAFVGAAGRLGFVRAAPRAAGGPGLCIVDRGVLPGARIDIPLAAAAAHVVPFTGDPGGVWMHAVEPMLREGNLLIAGVTSAPTLFCLQYLARDHAYSLVSSERGIVPLAALRAVAGADSGALIDLRHENYRDPRVAHSWLLAPRKV